MQSSFAQLRTGKEAGGFMDPLAVINDFDLKEGMQIAEFGSGAGFFVVPMARIVGPRGKVHALDILETSLDSVRAKAKSEHLDNIETVHTNLEVVGSSGLSDSSQDFVLLANILYQSNKKEEIIKEAHRVMKRGAGLAIIDWAKGSGGFGPPDNLRTDDISMQSLVVKTGFNFEHNISAGRFHYGLLFTKRNT